MLDCRIQKILLLLYKFANSPCGFDPGYKATSVAFVFYMDSIRTYVYVDGFNLYYRALRNTPYKWLDLKKLSSYLLYEEDTLLKIKYFTAIVSGKFDSEKPTRQKSYIRALKKFIPEIEIYYGKFLTHTIKAPLKNPDDCNGKKSINILKTEEKGSDVNLAVHLLNDAWLDRYDCALVLSNDSDLSESIRIVKTKLKKLVGIAIPKKCCPSQELIKLADFVKPIRSGILKKSSLPSVIPGTGIHKPPSWL